MYKYFLMIVMLFSFVAAVGFIMCSKTPNTTISVIIFLASFVAFIHHKERGQWGG